MTTGEMAEIAQEVAAANEAYGDARDSLALGSYSGFSPIMSDAGLGYGLIANSDPIIMAIQSARKAMSSITATIGKPKDIVVTADPHQRDVIQSLTGNEYYALDYTFDQLPDRYNTTANVVAVVDASRAGGRYMGLNISDAQFLARNGLDPWDAIYIGGGGDGYGLSRSVSNYTARIGAKNFFTHWEDNFSGNRIQNLLQIQDRIGAPTALVGHSWGGPDVISVAQWAKDNGIGLDLLATVDPVGQPSWNHYARPSDFQGLASKWTNINLTKSDLNFGNTVAALWGPTWSEVTAHADNNINYSDMIHGDFGLSMRRSGMTGIIEGIYKK